MTHTDEPNTDTDEFEDDSQRLPPLPPTQADQAEPASPAMEQDDSVAELDAPSMELDAIRDGDVPSPIPRSPQTRTILFLLATSVPRRPRAPSQPKQSVPMTAPLKPPPVRVHAITPPQIAAVGPTPPRPQLHPLPHRGSHRELPRLFTRPTSRQKEGHPHPGQPCSGTCPRQGSNTTRATRTPPLPANNAWIKPPAIVSKVAPNPPAQKAPPAQSPPPAQSAPPMPIHKPVPKTLPAAPKANGSSLAQDFALVARLASTIDPNEIALLASKLRLYKESPQNRLAAVCEHIGVLTAILNFNL
ncbi:uncharacterized protein LOC131840878 [Achroia grisella]|uniref:uncharacterized protein LOC131840878 n=1 Tax=Achroia grisella TaxID=688607 RepID=UPI0027D27786|nr:uncharacterized protein LOC131840878 [Achroia grisella]